MSLKASVSEPQGKVRLPQQYNTIEKPAGNPSVPNDAGLLKEIVRDGAVLNMQSMAPGKSIAGLMG
ncbi:MAG: hypothetical protein Q9163_003261 [Psora crenata]